MKTISQLFQSMMPIQQTPFEAKLLNCSLMSNGPSISMSDILYLIECFEGYGPECEGVYLTGSEYLKQFFKITASRQLSGIVTVKLCLTLHLILYEFQVGELVAEAMLSHSIPQPDSKDGYSNFIQNYSIYLMKIAQGLKVFYGAKVGQYPPVDNHDEPSKQPTNEKVMQVQQQNFTNMRKQSKFSVNNVYFQQYQQEKLEKQFAVNPGSISNSQKTLFLFKLHNLINTAQQILRSVIEILKGLKQHLQTREVDDTRHLFIEISCVIWNDIMVMYKFCGQEVNKLIDSFRNQQLHILLSTQQLYQSQIDITKNIRWIYENKAVFDVQRVVRKPVWFEENKQITLQIENAVIDLKVHGRLFSPGSARGKQVPFSARNAYQGSQINFFSKTPRSPQHILSSQKPSQDFQLKTTKRTQLLNKFTGGIFDDESECMSPRGLEQAPTKESTANSNKPLTHR